MIRQPTPPDAQMSWHAAAIDGLGDRPSTGVDSPECGWFKTRLVKNGPFVPARIWLHQEIDPDTGELCDDERFVCEIDGQICDAEEAWARLCSNPISEGEFNYLSTARRWSEVHAPHEPIANPRKPVDWLKVPTPKL